MGSGELERRNREVQGNAFLTSSPSCVRVMVEKQPLLENAAGEVVSPEESDS